MRLKWSHLLMGAVSLAGLLTLALSVRGAGAEVSKRQPPVTAWFSVEDSPTQVGGQAHLVLHLMALSSARQVNVEFFLPSQVQLIAGSQRWSGALQQNETFDLPIVVWIAQEGEYSIGAAVTAGGETAGATVNVIADSQSVEVSTDPLFLMKLRRAPSESQKRQLLDRTPLLLTPAPEAPGVAAATTASGTLRYQDDQGNHHPIRYALVQILDGATDSILAETLTLSDGSYSAAVNAESVKTRVLSEDGLRGFARVNPLGSPNEHYSYTSAPVPVTGSTTQISFDTDRPVRGTPGNPSNDVIHARAFMVLDALLQYQVQAFGMRGSFMAQAKANFPNGAGSPCPTISCYSPANQEMYILREDALDWDVIGHEFFHYVTNQGALRSIDNNPGGFHSGGSAIGQRPCPDCAPRNRDEGMRLAWSEGLATFMSVRLQEEPASTDFGMGWPGIPNVGDGRYQDTEDSTIDESLEQMSFLEGYGSENSVAGMFWDYTDTPSASAPGTATPGEPTDKFDFTPKIIWDVVNTLPGCDPCDRVDRFWSAVSSALSSSHSVLIDVAETVVLNEIGPALTEPAHGATVSGGLSPVFKWDANGDPSASHNPNRFFLAISKDGFQSDVHIYPTDGQPITTTQYQIPDAEWRSLVEGATDQDEFTWEVRAYREADTDIRIPKGSVNWLSNSRTFKVRAFHIRLTWTTLGADVDLHLRPPDGDSYVGWDYSNDCAYYNRSPDWGVAGDTTDNPFLDRDCITTCTEENITLDMVTTAGPYKVLAHYYRDHELGPTVATVQIFQNGQLIFSDSRTLNNVGDTPGGGDLWTVLRIVVGTSGEIQIVEEGSVEAGPRPSQPWWDLPREFRKDILGPSR